MTDQTKPSAGALRAANRIKELEVTAFTTLYVAQIIDRETGVAELLEAAKRADRWFDHFYQGKHSGQDTTPKQLRQAIAKAEGR